MRKRWKPVGCAAQQGDAGSAAGAAGDDAPAAVEPATSSPAASGEDARPVSEIGGRKGPEPTRYGDWEKNGRCIDF